LPTKEEIAELKLKVKLAQQERAYSINNVDYYTKELQREKENIDKYNEIIASCKHDHGEHRVGDCYCVNTFEPYSATTLRRKTIVVCASMCDVCGHVEIRECWE